MIRQRFAKLLLGIAVVASLAACGMSDPPTEVTAPLTAPRADRIWVSTDSLSLVKTSVPIKRPYSTHKVINARGGSVILAYANGIGPAFILDVPAGAVSEPTRFELTAVPGPYLMVDLRAYTQKGNGPEIDVGGQGFRVAVTLSVSKHFALLTDLTPTVVWVQNDHSLKPVPTRQDRFGYAVADLPHFSRWALASN